MKACTKCGEQKPLGDFHRCKKHKTGRKPRCKVCAAATCKLAYTHNHVAPLQGETVSGLHVLDNLQWLPAEENLRKGNKHE